jgi:S-adenosylmethionine hydrolase
VIDDEVRLPQSLESKPRIIHIDRFGNCVTNISRDAFEGKIASLKINGKTIRHFRDFYGEDSSHSPFAIWGSTGFLEISVNGGSAAKILRAKRGDEVVITSRKKAQKAQKI